MKTLWLRREDKHGEKRVPVTPREVSLLRAKGVEVVVERSSERCYSDEDYAAAGAILTEKPWREAPLDAIIIALKELAESDDPIAHTQIHFSHTFKGQDGAADVLSRYVRGRGVLYDLEFLNDEQGRRVAAFGYWAGYVGAALGLLGVAHYRHSDSTGMPPFPALKPFSDRSALIAAVDDALMAGVEETPIKVMVMGALGRCGSGARDLLSSLKSNIELTAWDLPEFNASDKPLRDAIEHDLFVNCVYLREPIAPMIDEDLLANNTRLSVISDVSCDPTSADNPIRVYDRITSLERPFVRARNGGGSPVYVQAIDHLPTLLPREASDEYAAALYPYLEDFLTHENPSVTWRDAKERFELALSEAAN